MNKKVIACTMVGVIAATCLITGIAGCKNTLNAEASEVLSTLTIGDECYFSYSDRDETVTASLDYANDVTVYQYSDSITPPSGSSTIDATGIKIIASSSSSYIGLTITYNYGCARWTVLDTTANGGDNVTSYGVGTAGSYIYSMAKSTYSIDDYTTGVVLYYSSFMSNGVYSMLNEEYATVLTIEFEAAGDYYIYDTANRWDIEVPNQDGTVTTTATVSGGVNSFYTTTTKTETESGLGATAALKMYRDNDSGYRYYLYAANYGAAYSLNYYDTSAGTADEQLLTSINQLMSILISYSYYTLFTTANSYSVGYSEGYTTGYEEGKTYGYQLGYNEGYDDGATEDLNFLDWIVACVNDFLDVQFFGTFSIGDLLMAAIAIMVCVILLKMFAGG